MSDIDEICRAIIGRLQALRYDAATTYYGATINEDILWVLTGDNTAQITRFHNG